MARTNPLIALSGQAPDFMKPYLALQDNRRANRLASLQEQQMQMAQSELEQERARQERVRNALDQLASPDLPSQQRQANVVRLYGDDPRVAQGVQQQLVQSEQLQRQRELDEARRHYLEAEYVLRNPEYAVDIWRRAAPDEYSAFAQQLGREPTPQEVIRLAHQARAHYGPLAGIDPMASRSDLPAAVQEWQYYSSLPPEQQQRYLQMKRATDRVVDIGGVPTLVQTGVRPITQPLSTLEDESRAAGEKRRAQEEAAAEVEEEKIRRQNERAYNAFKSAMLALDQAMEETETGPLVGRLPAFTAAQQTAEGAVAAMAPILKQLFRSAGEGTFTDRDQELLLDMVPKRTDNPEARRAKIAIINQIVADKLGIPTQQQPVRVSSPQERDALPPGTPYIAPDGTVRIKR